VLAIMGGTMLVDAAPKQPLRQAPIDELRAGKDRPNILFIFTDDHWELFDLDKDPDEMKSVYDNPEYKEIRAKLHKELERLRADLKVPEDTQAVKKKTPARPKRGKGKKKG